MKSVMHENLWMVALAASVLLSLTACGGGGGSSDTAAKPSSETPATPVTPVTPSVAVQSQKLAAGAGYSMAIGSDGKIQLWGTDMHGQVPTVASLAAVGAARWGSGQDGSWAVADDGSVSYWGMDAAGSLITNAVTLSGLGSVSAVRGCGSGNGAMLYVLKTNGQVWAVPARNLSGSTTGFAVSGLGEVKALGDGTDSTCSSMLAIEKDGSVWRFAASNPSDSTAVPTQVSATVVTGLNKVVQAACAMSSCLALTSEGKVMGWGLNDKGQAGNGTLDEQTTPTEVNLPAEAGGASKVMVSTAGAAYAIGKNQALYGWGMLDFGFGHSRGLTLVPSLLLNTTFGIKDIVVSPVEAGQTLVSVIDGHVFGWGGNASHELSTALSATSSTGPVQAAGISLN